MNKIQNLDSYNYTQSQGLLGYRMYFSTSQICETYLKCSKLELGKAMTIPFLS